LRKTEDLFHESVVIIPGEKQLHQDVEKFIVEKAKELQRNSHFRISIQILEDSSLDTSEITSYVRKHFLYKREKENQRVSMIIRLGLKSLLIAFTFLIIMYLVTNVMMSLMKENALLITLRELFIILAWVALWRPAELLLYEWRVHKQNAIWFDTIAKCEVRVVT
jgi:hypothetical protein